MSTLARNDMSKAVQKRQAIEKAIATAATMNELRTVVRHMLCMDLEKLDSVNGAALRKEGRAALAKAEEYEGMIYG